MIDRDGLLFLNRYERWATTRILDAATGIDAATWSEPNLIGERGMGASSSTIWGRTSVGGTSCPEAANSPRPRTSH